MPNHYEPPFPVDKDEYPFSSNWFERKDTILHYVDHGCGKPVLMLHGNPTWSYLYRNIIKGLDGSCRSIAPDYPGFGFSGHPPDYRYTPMEHAEWVCSLVNYLNLDNIILVVQDWGGPIGLSLATAMPERIAGIVLCNTWCWPPFFNVRIFSWIMGGPMGKKFNLKYNFFVKTILPSGLSKESANDPVLLKAYADPFPTPESRMGTYVFPEQIRKSSLWLKEIELNLTRLKDIPVEIVWAMKDPAFGKEAYIRRWLEHFPMASVDRVPHASHYIQEHSPDRVVGAIMRILDQARPLRLSSAN
ncbi:MAG: alpha/beta fold hydrolase [Proteobacteria bacterium]|nr:alpha/beta fold hydrolase [Pseudomonadota bacterium]